jgi:acyl-CoA reductase-like NAD-dependent aldehyde dehydrogenase
VHAPPPHPLPHPLRTQPLTLTSKPPISALTPPWQNQKPAQRKKASKDDVDRAIADFFREARASSSAVESEAFLTMMRELQNCSASYAPPSAMDLSEMCAMEAERRNTVVE